MTDNTKECGAGVQGAEVASVKWEGIPALELRAGDYRALVLPGFGGHLISLEDGTAPYLREPAGIAAYLLLPEAYGLPVLFPPNRIDNCRFSARGLDYHFPANKGGTFHLHGFLYNRPWQVDRIGPAAELELSFTSPRGGEVYRWFPHPFKARLCYRLEEGRLSQEISIENLDARPMPLMLGFHSAFALDDRARDPASYRISIGLGDALEKDQRQSAGAKLLEFLRGKIPEEKENIWGQFYAGTYQDREGRAERGLLIEHLRTGKKLRYLPDEQFGYWVIWNQNGDDTFICAEPQTCAINAANMHRDQDLFGFRMLEAGKTFCAKSLITVE
ncbi:MAG: aldose 1-epimerase [Treponema sp.]|jgi:aldose 1-epimerase|nr:aldose 1-epimerase [Treponema sp.]